MQSTRTLRFQRYFLNKKIYPCYLNFQWNNAANKSVVEWNDDDTYHGLRVGIDAGRCCCCCCVLLNRSGENVGDSRQDDDDGQPMVSDVVGHYAIMSRRWTFERGEDAHEAHDYCQPKSR